MDHSLSPPLREAARSKFRREDGEVPPSTARWLTKHELLDRQSPSRVHIWPQFSVGCCFVTVPLACLGQAHQSHWPKNSRTGRDSSPGNCLCPNQPFVGPMGTAVCLSQICFLFTFPQGFQGWDVGLPYTQSMRSVAQFSRPQRVHRRLGKTPTSVRNDRELLAVLFSNAERGGPRSDSAECSFTRSLSMAFELLSITV